MDTITFIQTSVSSSHNLANDRKRPEPDVKTNTQSWRKFALGVCKLTKQDHLRINNGARSNNHHRSTGRFRSMII